MLATPASWRWALHERRQRADGVVCGRGEGKVEVLTEDYVSVYLPTDEWNGRPRFEVTVR